MDKDFFKGRRVLVMGLGQFGGGADSAVFACKAGARVIVTDLADETKLTDSLEQLKNYDIEYHLTGHREEDFRDSDIIIVNPAVAPANRFIQIACDAGNLLTSQIEILFELCPAPIVGITGSNGKSTTAALTAHLLQPGIAQPGGNFGNIWLGGNIGSSPLLSSLDEIGRTDVVVLEISSFQIAQLERIRKGPAVAVITNLTPNHLDRHGSFQAYCKIKENLFRFQRLGVKQPAISIFNAEDPITMQWFNHYRTEKGRRCFVFNTDDVPRKLRHRFRLIGAANLSNLAAALAVAKYFGLSDERSAEAIAGFRGLEHRLELVAEISGVRWYNDSVATTPVSAVAALKAFDGPKIIIAGGYDKGILFDELGGEIGRSAKAAILLGRSARKIAEAIKPAHRKNVTINMVNSMNEAVNSAAALAEKGDVVVLSPACASYDMFDNYRRRGYVFKKLVKALAE